MKTYLSGCLFLLTFAGFVRGDAPSLKEARQHLLSGRYDEALTAYEALAKEPKNKVAAIIGMSRSLQSEGEYDKALGVVDEALKDNAGDADLLALRAEVLYLRG